MRTALELPRGSARRLPARGRRRPQGRGQGRAPAAQGRGRQGRSSPPTRRAMRSPASCARWRRSRSRRIAPEGSEFALVMIRRTEDGEVVMLGEVPDDVALVETRRRDRLARARPNRLSTGPRCVAAAQWPCSIAPPVRLQPYFGYRSRDRLMLIGARAARGQTRLRQARPAAGDAHDARAVRLAARKPACWCTLEIEVATASPCDVRGGDRREGFVRFDIALDPPFDLPPHPVWEVVALRWFNRDGPQCVEAYVLAPGTDSRLAVISDIDDTIIETGITGGHARDRPQLAPRAGRAARRPHRRARRRRVLRRARRRPAAAAGRAASRHTHPGDAPAVLLRLVEPVEPVLLPRRLPAAPRACRSARCCCATGGWNRATFGSGSHGVHKSAAIDAILAMYPEHALRADRRRHPGRPAGLCPTSVEANRRRGSRRSSSALARRTTVARGSAGQGHRSRRRACRCGWATSFAIGKDFLTAVGITPAGETEQIVKTVQQEVPKT